MAMMGDGQASGCGTANELGPAGMRAYGDDSWSSGYGGGNGFPYVSGANGYGFGDGDGTGFGTDRGGSGQGVIEEFPDGRGYGLEGL